MFTSELKALQREVAELRDKYADAYIRARIAEAEVESWKKLVSVLERLVPIPAPVRTSVTTAATASEPGQGPMEPQTFHVAESGEEYELRISKESALAHSLGVAPWSPAFQEAINQMRRDIMQPRIEKDEEGNAVYAKPYTEEEADDLVREAFRLAQAASSIRE